MNRRPEPPRDDWGRTQPAPRRPPVPPQRPPAQPPRQPAQPPRRPPPPRPPAQPPRQPAQPWYLEHRRPPAPTPAPPPAPTPPKQAGAQPQSNRGLLLAAGVTGALALALLLTLVLRGVIGGSPVELDVIQAQEGVRQVLTDPINGYGRDDVGDILCNDGVNPTVRKGRVFTCEVTVDGNQRQVLVEFADDAGTYEVDRPR